MLADQLNKAVAGLAAAAILAVGGSTAGAEARRVELGFDFYGGGLRLATMQTESRLDDGGYRIAAAFKTEGILDWIVGLELNSSAEGRLGPDGGAPTRFKSVTGGRWTGRVVEMTFAADGTADAKVSPPPDDDKREAVPAELRRGVFDPLSASLLTAMFMDPLAVCQRTLAVFDGRRRFDLEFKVIAPENLKRSSYSPFDGRALKCSVTYQRIAGFKKKKRKRRNEPPPYTIWLARFEETGLTLPVRLEAETKWGSLIAHLARLQVVRDGYAGAD